MQKQVLWHSMENCLPLETWLPIIEIEKFLKHDDATDDDNIGKDSDENNDNDNDSSDGNNVWRRPLVSHDDVGGEKIFEEGNNANSEGIMYIHTH